MATGFFATTANLIEVSSKDFYPIFNNTSVVGGFNSGMLDTTTGTALVPEEGVYDISSSLNFEFNFAPPQFTVRLIAEIDGAQSRLISETIVKHNDANTYTLNGPLQLEAGQRVRIKLWTSVFNEGTQYINGHFGSFFAMTKH